MIKTYKVISPDFYSVQMKNAKHTMLYEYLSDKFPEVQIRTITYYDYSEFLFFFDAGVRTVPVQALYDAFVNAPIRSDTSFCDYQAGILCKGPRNDLESILQKHCNDNERYVFAISGIQEDVTHLSQNDVADWYQKYVYENRIQMIVSPCSQRIEAFPPVPSPDKNTENFRQNNLKPYCNIIDSPEHGSFELVMFFDGSNLQNDRDLYCAELLACILEDRFCVEGSEVNAKQPLLEIDAFTAKITLSFSSAQTEPEKIVAWVKEAINELPSFIEKNLEYAKQEVVSRIRREYSNQLNALKFTNWNGFNCLKYSLDGIVQYEGIIRSASLEEVQKMCSSLLNPDRMSFFGER